MPTPSSCSCSGCGVAAKIASLLLLLTTGASLYGVYVTHFGYEGATFGSNNASVALIAFAVNLGFFMKIMKKACGCCPAK